MSKKISYYLFLGVVGIIKIIPFWILYRFSDFVYLIIAYLVRYRSSVIDKNLNKCFPEKSRSELKHIKHKFYKNLCDLVVETIKGFSMSNDQILKRFKVFDCQIIDKYYNEGKNVIVLTAHLANWEWTGVPISKHYLHRPIVLYKPLSNPYINKFINDNRLKTGVDLASIFKTKECFTKKYDNPVAFYMLADQFPPKTERQIRVAFFNSLSPFLDGPEKYAFMHQLPVVYTEISREKRGYYSLRTYDITDNPEKLQKNELTALYAKLLESSIKAQPEDWAWSHKRWKRELYSF